MTDAVTDQFNIPVNTFTIQRCFQPSATINNAKCNVQNYSTRKQKTSVESHMLNEYGVNLYEYVAEVKF